MRTTEELSKSPAHWKSCDELSRETDDFLVFEEFSSIVTYFDRYDNVQALFSHILFMQKDIRTASMSLLGNKVPSMTSTTAFSRQCSANACSANRYITSYGKRKLKLILKGIDNVQNGEASYKDVIVELRRLMKKLYTEVHAAYQKERMSGLWSFQLKQRLSETRSGTDRL